MTRRRTVLMPQPSEHRQSRRAQIERRYQLADIDRINELCASTKMFINLCSLSKRAHRRVGMRQRQLAPLRIHDIEVKLIREPLKQSHRLGVKTHTLWGQVIGANHRRITRRIATAQIGLF